MGGQKQDSRVTCVGQTQHLGVKGRCAAAFNDETAPGLRVLEPNPRGRKPCWGKMTLPGSEASARGSYSEASTISTAKQVLGQRSSKYSWKFVGACCHDCGRCVIAGSLWVSKVMLL